MAEGYSVSRSVPPPVGGWDTRESIADMPVDHAIILENWFPGTDKVEFRRGNTSHATGMSGAVESLIDYTPLSGTSELFAANGGNIFDVSSAGAVGAAVASGKTNDRWQHVNIGNSAGQFVRLFNGEDASLLYDGSTWATTAITGSGLTAANLIWCNLHHKRLWVGETGSLSAWYLAANAVSGGATEFPLASECRLGGFIMAMGTWTRDAGDGLDDVACFLTSEGEVLVYSGTDPADPTTWFKVGRFTIGKPIGRRCIIQAGPDLILVTQDGFVPLSAILTLDRSQARKASLSDQIQQAVNDSVRLYGSTFGWQPILYPRGTMLIFNIPQSGAYDQYVFNTITGAPCKFTGMDILCMGMLNDAMYFGSDDGVVYKFDDGTSDNGSNIKSDMLPAFNYFGMRGRTKAFKSAEPIFQSNGNPNAALDFNIDFQIAVPSGVATAVGPDAATWGVGKWGVGTWGSEDQIYSGWRGIRGDGRSGSLRIRIDSKTARPSLIATNFLFIPGGQM